MNDYEEAGGGRGPTLSALRAYREHRAARDDPSAGADAEFRKALGRYRHGQYEDAITECYKALESTLKVICEWRRWPFDAEKTSASKLFDTVFDEGLIPKYLRCGPGVVDQLGFCR